MTALTPPKFLNLMLRRDLDDRCEFLMISVWESMDSIRAFAGDEPGRAVFYPEDDRSLIEHDTTVRHYLVESATDATFLGDRLGSKTAQGVDGASQFCQCNL